MDIFIAQLNQMLMSAKEDNWLAELCNLLMTHLGAWVYIVSKSGKTLVEVIPFVGNLPEDYSGNIARPIISNSDAIGHLVCRREETFSKDEEQMMGIALSICTIILRQEEKQTETERRKRLDAVREAINALSFSELEAAIHITIGIKGHERRLVAGHIADMLGFTRSVVVNALKKLEGAGMIETRSLGTKGTYIKIREPILAEELGKLGTVKGF